MTTTVYMRWNSSQVPGTLIGPAFILSICKRHVPGESHKPMSQKSLPSMVIMLFLAVVAATGLAANGQTVSKAPDQSSKAIADSGEADDDNPDIPRIGRGRIDEATYLRLRSEQAAEKRGMFDLLQNPQMRSQAIRQMERQEQLLRQRFASQARSVSFIFGPIWTPLGPAPIPNGQTDPNLNPANELAVSGRVTAIAVDPANAQIAYVGTAQGGLYRTMDQGVTWQPLMDSAQSLAIGAITIDPTDSNIVFVGTGEGNFSADSFFGVGLYIIQGATTASPSLFGPFNSNGTTDVFTGRSITQILVNPSDHNKVMVSTTSGFSGISSDTFSALPARGVYLSTNALSGSPTFSQITVQPVANRAVTDMVMDPGNVNTIVVNVFGAAAAGDGGLWTSTSGDPWAGTATWTQTITKQAIGKLAVNRSGAKPATTFFATFDEVVSCTPPSGPPISAGGTMKTSTDGGLSWVAVPAATGFCGSQCFYDMAPAIDPTNVNNIYIGGSAGRGTGSCRTGILGKSTDGGATFTPSQNFLHADSHVTAIAPSNPSVIYAGNDGGVFLSTDAGATWSSINTSGGSGFNATQFESLSLHPSDPNFTIGGTQDNGTEFMKPDGSWTRADFGDGGFSAIDQGSVDTTNVTMYHTYFNARNSLIGFAQVTNTGNAKEGNWNFFGCGSGNPGNNGINCADFVLFYAPLALGPGTPNTVYFGTDHLYRSADRGVTNVPVSQALIASVPISAIGISAQDDNVRIVGLRNGHVFASTNGTTTMVDITGPWPLKYIARAVIDPNNKDTAYVTLNGYGTPNHVWKTTNLSSFQSATPAPPTWVAASTGLPDVPVNSFAVDAGNSSFLYAGADIGVFFSTDGGATWNPFGLGLPRVAVFDLNIQPSAHKVRIGTHGRGAWEAAAARFDNTTAVSANNTIPAIGASFMVSATVNKGTGIRVPTGTVIFAETGAFLGTATLDNTGTATFTTSFPAAGAHTISAAYAGDSYYLNSTSATGVVINVGADYTVTAPAATATVTAGQNATYTITVTPQNGFTNTVSFNCSGLPVLASCTFMPATITPGGSAASSTLTISTTAHTSAAPVSSMSQTAGFTGGVLTGLGLLGLVIVGGVSRRKRLWQSASLLLIALVVVATMIGCGGGSPPLMQQPSLNPNTGTPAGTSMVTVTSTSGSITHQLPLTLTVQ